MFWTATIRKILNQFKIHKELNDPDNNKPKPQPTGEKIGLAEALRMF